MFRLCPLSGLVLLLLRLVPTAAVQRVGLSVLQHLLHLPPCARHGRFRPGRGRGPCPAVPFRVSARTASPALQPGPVRPLVSQRHIAEPVHFLHLCVRLPIHLLAFGTADWSLVVGDHCLHLRRGRRQRPHRHDDRVPHLDQLGNDRSQYHCVVHLYVAGLFRTFCVWVRHLQRPSTPDDLAVVLSHRARRHSGGAVAGLDLALLHPTIHAQPGPYGARERAVVATTRETASISIRSLGPTSTCPVLSGCRRL
mmetsp:Transcript_500/g.962  ORF Transcript_500/g.962 Transcript_500/m.962 type:complete len:253 (+) Transcript_500:957-1715(+)